MSEGILLKTDWRVWGVTGRQGKELQPLAFKLTIWGVSWIWFGVCW